MTHQASELLSRIALQNAELIASAIGLAFLLVAQRYLGRWPDLWRIRRVVLPVLDRISDGDYDEQLDAVDDRIGVDLESTADVACARPTRSLSFTATAARFGAST